MSKVFALSREELMQKLKAAIEQMRQVCEPEFVVLFGSFAYGEPHEGSDVDVLAVYADDVKEAARREAGSALHRAFGTRLQVHPCTLSQWRESLLKRNWFLAEITRRGVPLFSRLDWTKVLEEVDTLMSQSENIYPLEWIQWVEDDWDTVQVMLVRGRVFVAAYHLQKAVEKLLKAFLLHHGWELERTHDLEELLREAVRHEASLQRFQPLCHRVKYFVAAWYPGLPNPPTEEELRQQWLPQAEELLLFVRQAVGVEAPAKGDARAEPLSEGEGTVGSSPHSK